MGIIIEWINDNNGFIMGLLTLVYVIATILICFFNYKSAKATKEQIKEAQAQFRLQNRPNVIPCFSMIEGAMFCLTFKNIGNECAKDLKIKINDKWLECFDEALKIKQMPGDIRASLKNKFFIVPDNSIKFVLMIPGDGTDMYNIISQEKICIELEYYRNDSSEKFVENFELDLLTMAGLILDKSDYIRKMEKQGKTLKDISDNINKISKSINNLLNKS